jgi:hypothetical protein
MRFVTRAVPLVVLLACGGDGASSPEPVAPSGPVVTTIVIATPEGPLEVGGTLALSAEVRDQAGTPITGKTLTWASANRAVATVSNAGVVTGVSPGLAAITASVDSKTGSANVSVTQVPVFTVTIEPLAAPAVAGETTPLTVVLRDEDGNELLGRQVVWSSSAALVATVDASGRLVATSPGVTTITASSEGVSGTLPVTVTPPVGSVAPTIQSIAPATLAPGATATLRGTGFLGVANTTVMIAVPRAGFVCQSTQPAPVVVATVGGMATTSHPLAVARTRSLAVGESFVTGASGDIGCNELSAGGRYLVSVFNGATSTSETVRFELRGSAGGALASRLPTGGMTTAGTEPTRSIARSAASAAEHEHLDRLDADRAVLQRLGAPRRGRLAPSYSRAGMPPVPLIVGDLAPMKFHYSSCSAAGVTPVTARVVFIGEHSVVLEDTTSALARKIDADLIAIAQEFESVSYPLLLNFGNPLARDASTDGNGRILILFTPKVNALASNILGFVAACDLYPVLQDPAVAGSNEAEIFYARTVTDTSAGSTSLSGRSQWRRQMPATMIHEAKHIASYAERLSRGATQFEQVWLEEATAQVASEMFGRAIHGNTWRGDATYRQTLYCEERPAEAGCANGVIAMSNHFRFLSDYLQRFEAKSILSGAEDSDIYGSAWLFTRWLLDTYGGSDEGAFLRRLVQSANLTGAANVEAVSGRPFPQLFAEFTLMLAADNVPNVDGPHVEPSWNLPDVFEGLATIGAAPKSPLALRQSAGGALSVSGRNVKGGSAVLIRIGPLVAGASQLLELKSTLTTPLAVTSPVGLAVVRIE